MIRFIFPNILIHLYYYRTCKYNTHPNSLSIIWNNEFYKSCLNFWFYCSSRHQKFCKKYSQYSNSLLSGRQLNPFRPTGSITFSINEMNQYSQLAFYKRILLHDCVTCTIMIQLINCSVSQQVHDGDVFIYFMVPKKWFKLLP